MPKSNTDPKSRKITAPYGARGPQSGPSTADRAEVEVKTASPPPSTLVPSSARASSFPSALASSSASASTSAPAASATAPAIIPFLPADPALQARKQEGYDKYSAIMDRWARAPADKPRVDADGKDLKTRLGIIVREPEPPTHIKVDSYEDALVKFGPIAGYGVWAVEPHAKELNKGYPIGSRTGPYVGVLEWTQDGKPTVYNKTQLLHRYLATECMIIYRGRKSYIQIGKLTGFKPTQIKALWEGSILKNLTRNLPWSEPTAKYTKETKITVAMSIINQYNAGMVWDTLRGSFPGLTTAQIEQAWTEMIVPAIQRGELP